MKKLYLLLTFTIGMGCASFGPTPKVSVVKGELKAVKPKAVGAIFIPAPTGMLGGSTTAVMAVTMATYLPPQGVPTKALNLLMRPLGLSDSIGNAVLAEYQFEFVKALNAYKKRAKKNKKAKTPKKIKLPQIAGFPKSMGAAKSLAKTIKRDQSKADAIVKALDSGKQKQIGKTLFGAKPLMKQLNSLAGWLMDKSDATYVLLTHVDGSEKDWKAGKPLTVSAAMVNTKSGRFRYFATVKDKKGGDSGAFFCPIGDYGWEFVRWCR